MLPPCGLVFKVPHYSATYGTFRCHSVTTGAFRSLVGAFMVIVVIVNTLICRHVIDYDKLRDAARCLSNDPSCCFCISVSYV